MVGHWSIGVMKLAAPTSPHILHYSNNPPLQSLHNYHPLQQSITPLLQFPHLLSAHVHRRNQNLCAGRPRRQRLCRVPAREVRPKGGPSGGNGGRGGDVILEADHDLNNLIAQYYQPRLIAPGRRVGMGKGMDGHAGKDLVVKVPCGTLVWRLPTAMPALRPAAKPSPSRARAGLLASSSRRPLMRSGAAASARWRLISRAENDDAGDRRRQREAQRRAGG